MKSLMIKTKCSSNTAKTTICDPRSRPGDYKDCGLQIRRINNIPAGISSNKVLIDFINTVDATAYTPLSARFEFNYSDLGSGKIIR